MTGDEKQHSINESVSSGSSCMNNKGIPEALSFEKILSGGTCPPCTVRDFLNYLKYIEHSAENLQFYLWFQDYSARFEKLPKSEQVLSPVWNKTHPEPVDPAASATSNRTSAKVNPKINELLQGTDFADPRPGHSDKVDPFDTPDKTPSLEEKRDGLSEYGSSTGEYQSTVTSSTMHQSKAESAFEEAGLKWKPFTAQPYRDEINRIISTYIKVGASRELNLSERERSSTLHALQNTTHPSALQQVLVSVEYSLRRQAHPNFIRWTICNGNRPRVVFARGLGVAGILIGFLADLLITLSHANRGWRVLPFIAWFIGISTLIAAWKGMCVVLHGMHHRHLRPWELFADQTDETDEALDEKARSFDSLLSDSTNSFEDEPWIAKYQKRNVIRKIFDRELWIKEPALRQIQDTIFLQALLGALVLSAIIVGIFCAFPKGNYF